MMKLLLITLSICSFAYSQVTVKVSKDDNTINFMCSNPFEFDITIDLIVDTRYLKTKTNLPLITVVKAKSSRNILSFKIEDKKRYFYKYRFITRMGNKNALHNDNYLYRIPFEKGHKKTVSQGYNGKASHFGSSQYAVDFRCKIGTKIYAAREGIVVRTKSDSTKGGPNRQYIKDANEITILHNDGTFSTYSHLKYGGIRVHVGQKINRGDFLGFSGNTGYTKGPHLHFIVHKAKSGHSHVSLPIKFQTDKGVIKNPKVGMSYSAI